MGHILLFQLLLSNNLAMLTQGRPGSCLELVLNNGEVLYAVLDPENDYNPPSPRLMLVILHFSASAMICAVFRSLLAKDSGGFKGQ